MDFDSLSDDSLNSNLKLINQHDNSSAANFDNLVDDSEKYETPGQQIKAGVEGIASGLAGPVAPLVEKHLLGVKPEDIRAREEANPITHGIGQAVGLGAGLLTGTGEAAVMTKAGELAAGLSGLGKVAETSSLGFKIGHEAVKQAAEMAVLSSGDEVSKMILKDPSSSAESAISNIGLSAALGGLGGAAIAGVISPLWKATAGPKVEEMLTGLKAHINGENKVVLPEVIQKSFADLGIEPHPVMKAALSGNQKALAMAQDLYRAQNKDFLSHLYALPDQLKNSVSESLGIPLEEAAIFSNKESGDQVRSMAIKDITERYQPIADALDARNAKAATINVPDEERRDFGSRLMEKAVGSEVGTDSPLYKEYDHYAQRVLAKDTIKGLDSLSTELYDRATSMGTDKNVKRALFDIRNSIQNFKEQQILKYSKDLAEQGIDSGLISHAIQSKAIRPVGSHAIREADIAAKELKDATQLARSEGQSAGEQLINERAEVNRSYAEYAKTMDDLAEHLGLGDFKGTGSFKEKLNGLTAEQLIKKFAVKDDIESIPFLKENFPEIAEAVRQHEAKDFLSKSVHDNLGKSTLDIKSLNKRVEGLMKGQPEYAEHILGQNAIDKIQSAKVINDAISRITNIKDSGTPGGLGKVYRHIGAGAMGAVGYLMGHGPVTGMLVGEAAQRLGKDAPEAIKLGLLKFMASDQEIKSEGFKSMIDFFHNTYKGENLLSKATSNLLKSGSQVILSKIPDANDREKMDKLVTKYQANPEGLLHQDQALGHYLPNHQMAMSESSTRALQYLQSIKPHAYRSGPMDREIQPSPMEMARYDRALDIAQKPIVVLEHIKNGTLQSSDIQDLVGMFPALYKQMANKISNEVISHQDSPISYQTRLGISLFLGQPLDSSILPSSIIAAQPQPQMLPPVQNKKSSSTLGKNTIKQYMTSTQAAETNKFKH